MQSFRANPVRSVEELLEIHAIQQLKYRYMRAIDTLDWDLIESCFAEDASVWYMNGAIRTTGRDSIVSFFRDNIGADHFSTHIALHPEISLIDGQSAEAIWRFQDIVFTTRETDPHGPTHGLHSGQRVEGAGIYYDEYVKVGSQWLIKSTGFIRIYEFWTRPGYASTRDFQSHIDQGLKVLDARGVRERL